MNMYIEVSIIFKRADQINSLIWGAFAHPTSLLWSYQ